MTNPNEEPLRMRVYGEPTLPSVIYLPGLHGDWTLVGSFRTAVAGKVRFVEFTYPRTTAWSLEDYAAAIAEAMSAQGVDRGWLLAESFGSQIAWALLERECRAMPQPPRFQPLGVILAGGFVRHPVLWGVRAAARLLAAASSRCIRLGLAIYVRYARFRHRHAPETLAAVREFVDRRSAPLDRAAAVHRLDLIAGADPRPVARAAQLPVYYLAGLVDPLVPWPWVRLWLRRHCPAYRRGKTLWTADHNVLATAPAAAARQVLQWMTATQIPVYTGGTRTSIDRGNTQRPGP